MDCVKHWGYTVKQSRSMTCLPTAWTPAERQMTDQTPVMVNHGEGYSRGSAGPREIPGGGGIES